MVLAEWTGQTLFYEKIENLCEKKFCLFPSSHHGTGELLSIIFLFSYIL